MGLLSPGQPSEQPAPVQPSSVHEDARLLLRRWNIHCIEVVSVDHDSILFRGFNRMARTAWIGMRNGRVALVVPEDGFNAEPNGWTSARLARACNPEQATDAEQPSENAD